MTQSHCRADTDNHAELANELLHALKGLLVRVDDGSDYADGHAIAEARRIAAKAEATLDAHYGVPSCGDSECPSGDYPRYGVAPHEHDESGATKLLPRDQWPASFTEDPVSPGYGVYWCPRCVDAQKAVLLARAMTEPEGDVE